MSPRSIRRAQERQAKKLARKAEKAAGQAASEIGPASLSQPPSPEFYDEFSPEFIAEANAVGDLPGRIQAEALLQRAQPRRRLCI